MQKNWPNLFAENNRNKNKISFRKVNFIYFSGGLGPLDIPDPLDLDKNRTPEELADLRTDVDLTNLRNQIDKNNPLGQEAHEFFNETFSLETSFESVARRERLRDSNAYVAARWSIMTPDGIDQFNKEASEILGVQGIPPDIITQLNRPFVEQNFAIDEQYKIAQTFFFVVKTWVARQDELERATMENANEPDMAESIIDKITNGCKNVVEDFKEGSISRKVMYGVGAYLLYSMLSKGGGENGQTPAWKVRIRKIAMLGAGALVGNEVLKHFGVDISEWFDKDDSVEGTPLQTLFMIHPNSDNLDSRLLKKMGNARVTDLLDAYDSSSRPGFVDPNKFLSIFGTTYMGVGPYTTDENLRNKYLEDGKKLHDLIKALEESYYLATGKNPNTDELRTVLASNPELQNADVTQLMIYLTMHMQEQYIKDANEIVGRIWPSTIPRTHFSQVSSNRFEGSVDSQPITLHASNDGMVRAYDNRYARGQATLDPSKAIAEISQRDLQNDPTKRNAFMQQVKDHFVANPLPAPQQAPQNQGGNQQTPPPGNNPPQNPSAPQNGQGGGQGNRRNLPGNGGNNPAPANNPALAASVENAALLNSLTTLANSITGSDSGKMKVESIGNFFVISYGDHFDKLKIIKADNGKWEVPEIDRQFDNINSAAITAFLVAKVSYIMHEEEYRPSKIIDDNPFEVEDGTLQLSQSLESGDWGNLSLIGNDAVILENSDFAKFDQFIDLSDLSDALNEWVKGYKFGGGARSTDENIGALEEVHEENNTMSDDEIINSMNETLSSLIVQADWNQLRFEIKDKDNVEVYRSGIPSIKFHVKRNGSVWKIEEINEDFDQFEAAIAISNLVLSSEEWISDNGYRSGRFGDGSDPFEESTGGDIEFDVDDWYPRDLNFMDASGRIKFYNSELGISTDKLVDYLNKWYNDKYV